MQDRFFVPASTGEYADVSWFLGAINEGRNLSSGAWNSSAGASSVTVTAKDYANPANPEASYTLTFGVSTAVCVEAEDTVATTIGACNPSNNGTQVTFTYTNTDDATDWYRKGMQVNVEFWNGDYAIRDAYVLLAQGEVADGASASVTGGDASEIGSYNGQFNQFRLYPGTYRLWLYGAGVAPHYLANTLFVPPCGTSSLVPDDPMGGPLPAWLQSSAKVGQCTAKNTVKVRLDARSSAIPVDYRVTSKPRRGKKKERAFQVGAGARSIVTLRKQRSGTLVKVSVGSKVLSKRRLSC